jgi:Ser/Thr protein kinase RdoA (MazF antagonist)
MTAGDALRIAARFGVDGIAANELGGGWVNENWLVESRKGERFVVRRYDRLHVTRRAVFFEHAIMLHAAQRVPEVRPPLAAADGDTIVFEDGRFFAVLPYVAGRTGDRGAAADAARVLARFHLALAAFRPARPRAARSVGALAWLRDRFLRFAAQPHLARKLDWDALVVGVTRALTRVLPHAGRLPLATVHGDPHPDNVVVADGRVRALLDFDFAHETERLYDVASGADAFGRAVEGAPLDLAAALGFANAYQAEARLTDEEWELVPDLMIRRNAFLVWYIVSRHGQRAFGDVGNADRYARRVAELDGLRAEWRRRPA